MSLTSTTPQTSPLDRQVIRDFLDGRVEAIALPEPNWGPIGQEVFERTYARNVELRMPDGEVVGTVVLVAGCDGRRQRGQRGLGVREDADLRGVVLPNLLRVEVDLDERLGNRHASPVGHHFRESAPDRNERIGVGQCMAAPDRAGVAE